MQNSNHSRYYWAEFTETLEFVGDPDRQEFFTAFYPHATGGTVKITCCDASAMLKECYNEYDQVVGFSATLKPFDYYVRLSGLDSGNVKTAEFESPFPGDRRKLLIIPHIPNILMFAAYPVTSSIVVVASLMARQ